jgi:hypothetical protein
MIPMDTVWPRERLLVTLNRWVADGSETAGERFTRESLTARSYSAGIR